MLFLLGNTCPTTGRRGLCKHGISLPDMHDRVKIIRRHLHDRTDQTVNESGSLQAPPSRLAIHHALGVDRSELAVDYHYVRFPSKRSRFGLVLLIQHTHSSSIVGLWPYGPFYRIFAHSLLYCALSISTIKGPRMVSLVLAWRCRYFDHGHSCDHFVHVVRWSRSDRDLDAACSLGAHYHQCHRPLLDMLESALQTYSEYQSSVALLTSTPFIKHTSWRFKHLQEILYSAR